MKLFRNLSGLAYRHLPTRRYIDLQEWVRPVLQKQRRRGGRTVDILADGYRVTWEDGTVFHFAHAQRYGRYMHRDGLEYIFEFMRQKYQDEDVAVESGDIVVEVGTNVGEFACAVSAKARKIFAFEPDVDALPSLRRNSEIYKNIEVLPFAAGTDDGEIVFYIETSTSDSSIIEPAQWSRKVTVPTRTLASVMREHGIEQVDYLKVEAEGYEPEVLTGAESALSSVRKVAVDCSPERNGESTFDSCESILAKAGFRTWRRIDGKSMMLFGLRTE